MKALLISANQEQINMPTLPLGLACVATAAREAGHNVAMLDLLFSMDHGAAIEKTIAEFNPQIIGISVRNIDDLNMAFPRFFLEDVKAILSACRSATDAPVVLGGAGYSIFPESAMMYLGADMGIAGEGECAFPALLSVLQNGGDPSEIPGLYIAGRGLQQPRQHAKDLDSLPLPDIGLLSPSASEVERPMIPVQTRRGCPHECSYCSTPAIEGMSVRQRSPEAVVDWLEQWTKLGHRDFFFVDNTFNQPAAYAEDLCSRIIKNGLDIRWRGIVYPKNVDEELVRLMAAAGCCRVSLGFESGCDEMLSRLNNRFSPEEVRTVSSMFADNGMERMGFLLLGSPGETKESVEESLAFADSLDLDALRVTVGVRLYPNTLLAKIAVDEGVIPESCDLLYPRFYLAKGLEDWLPGVLDKWRSSRPSVIM